MLGGRAGVVNCYNPPMGYRTPLLEAPLLVVATSVTAVDRRTGAQRWTHDLEAAARKLAILDDRIFVLDARAKVTCIDLQSGVVVGKVELDLSGPNALIADGETLYVSGDRELVALDRSGAVLWKTPMPPNDSSSKTGLAVPGVVVLQPDFDGR